MASTNTPAYASTSSLSPSTVLQRKPRQKRPNYNYIHRNLLPLEIHPLPNIIPHNPLSLVAVALSYLIQVISPPKQPIYNGYFSSATSSIHVTDPKTFRRLWEMGFFGRGSLSRSEPTWLESQQRRGETAEENTGQRREERRKAKTERAKKELKDLEEKLREESDDKIKGDRSGDAQRPPVQDEWNEHPEDEKEDQLHRRHNNHKSNLSIAAAGPDGKKDGEKEPPDIPDELRASGAANGYALKTNINDLAGIASVLEAGGEVSTLTGAKTSENGTIQINGYEEWRKTTAPNGVPTPPPTTASSDSTQADGHPVMKLQRTKSVRFSPTIEAREFDLSAPVISPLKSPGPSLVMMGEKKELAVIENQEHLQLSLEEAFFLTYSLGVLHIYCDDSDTTLPPLSLLSLFRRHSYFPPRSLSVPAEPDDPFMISYAVYHHYRSLGWVVRSGVKFSVDYLLYNRGPAFSHAEFALVILPSYSHSYWTERKEIGKAWWWLHNVNRVQAQVKKSLVLCYVDVPPPPRTGEQTDIGKLFKRYKIRDVGVKRWTPNRSRD